MKLKYFLILLFLFSLSIEHLTFNITYATVRYVSKTGSSTFPYTSWETAADSIQKCINICVENDTIYVANGVYYEAVYVDKTINLWGSSMDSTVIDGTNIIGYDIIYFYVNNSTFKNFTIKSSIAQRIGIRVFRANIKAESCRITDIDAPIIVGYSSVDMKNLLVNNFDYSAIREECPNDSCYSSYSSNIILSRNGLETTVLFSFGGYPTFTNNIVIGDGNISRGIDIQYHKGAVVKNNLISGYRNINLRAGEIRTDTAHFENNNLMYSATGTAISSSTGHRTKSGNNIIKNTLSGIQSSNGTLMTDYNLFWNVTNKIGGTAIWGNSNIVADPMFVKDTIPTINSDYDFNLQKYSPAIDKGDPSILDVDGSRSDIGMFGGPYGTEIYLSGPCTKTSQKPNCINGFWSCKTKMEQEHRSRSFPLQGLS